MKRIPAAMAMSLVLLTAACGGEDGPTEDRPAAATSTPASADPTERPTRSDSATATETRDEPPSAPTETSAGNSEQGTPDPAEVRAIARTLGCDLGAGKQTPDGETEYACGEFLIVDWGTADVTEDEMWAYVDSWVDDDRPTYLPADEFILVYGTEAALQPFTDELLG